MGGQPPQPGGGRYDARVRVHCTRCAHVAQPAGRTGASGRSGSVCVCMRGCCRDCVVLSARRTAANAAWPAVGSGSGRERAAVAHACRGRRCGRGRRTCTCACSAGGGWSCAAARYTVCCVRTACLTCALCNTAVPRRDASKELTVPASPILAGSAVQPLPAGWAVRARVSLCATACALIVVCHS
jgi:hypothetical protein